MPQNKGWSTVQIREEIKTKFKEIYKKDKKRPVNQTFNGYMDELFKKIISHNEQLEKYGSLMEISKISNNEIEIIDRRKLEKRIVTIYIDKQLRCSMDGKNDCVHIGFCLAIPETYKEFVNKSIEFQ
ncbi:MAG: hypothetical protein ACPKPY_09780 [Nitrososphaeraceae archaeon]